MRSSACSNRFKKFEHDWELKHLQNKDIVFRNTFQDIEYVLKTLSETGTRFEFECYDTAHLYNLNYFLEQGMVKPPLFVQTVFGLQGGTGAHPEDVLHMKRTADRLFGDKMVWSVLGAGRNQIADRGDGRRHGRQHPRRPGRFAVGGAGPDGGIERRAGARSPARSSKVSASRWRPRTRPAKFSTSRAATSWKSERFRRLMQRSSPLRTQGPIRRVLSIEYGVRDL